MSTAPPDATPEFTNRLARETSPYLLQHAHNPVDWYPWGEEALQRAQADEKPIFLSIGYSACHWCHVMERESFENPQIAGQLNEHFINIKVDREERPDLDEIYMNAVVAMTGSGGWPMSVFLTPDREPFYGGTYYPPTDMHGRPGFPSIIKAVSSAWENRRDEVMQSAKGMREHLEQQLQKGMAGRGTLDATLLDTAVLHLKHSFDGTYGGWGSAPKFPSSGAIQLLLRQQLRAPEDAQLHMLHLTLEKMADGGMYDHLGGGFHRYSVDERWLVPHFEKMLYDNAQLAQAYLEAWQATARPQYRKVVEEILDYVLRDMQGSDGGFYSTEDADSEGQEGKFYLWTNNEVRELLGPDLAPLFCAYYNVRTEGNFSSHESYHAAQNILHVTRDLPTVAADFGQTAEAAAEKITEARHLLMQARDRRVRPGLDDKIITAWNGLMLTAVAQAAQVLNVPRYRDAAVRAGEFLYTKMYREERLLRTARHGEAKLPGYLDDYAFTANAFLDLYQATFDPQWLERARSLAGKMQEYFWDEQGGSFYYTSTHHQDVLLRTRPTYDGAEPSGNSIAALALLRLSRFFDDSDAFHQGMMVLESSHSAMHRAPQGYLKMLCAVDFALGPRHEIAIITPEAPSPEDPLLRVAQQRFLPRAILAAAQESQAPASTQIPLLSNRPAIEGLSTAYVCQNFACELPVTDPAALAEKLP